MRTSINVLGDAYGAAIVEHLTKNQLKKLDEEAEQEYTRIMTAAAGVNCTNEMKPSDTSTSIRIDAIKPNDFERNKSFTTMNRPPSLQVIDAVRRRSKMIIINPNITSTLSYSTIPYIHSDNETNL